MRYLISIILVLSCVKGISQEAYFPANNSNTDQMGNHTITLQNSATYTSTYKVEGTHSFDFNQSSTNRGLTDNFDWSTGGRTISFWFRTARTTGNGIIFSTQSNTEAAKGISVKHETEFDRLIIDHHNGTTHQQAFTINNSIQANTDYFIVIKWMDVNGANVSVYIDDVLKSTADSTALAGAGSVSTFSIGCSKEANAYSIYGYIDQLRFWDCALSRAKVTELYTNRTSNYELACVDAPPEVVEMPPKDVIWFNRFYTEVLYQSGTPPPPDPEDHPPIGNPYAGMNALYVDINGNDNNAGTTPETAIRTYGRAVTLSPNFQIIAFSDTTHYVSMGLTNWDGTALANKIIGTYYIYGNYYSKLSGYMPLGAFSQVSTNIWAVTDNNLPVGGLRIPSGVGDIFSRFITYYSYLLRSDGAKFDCSMYPKTGFLNSTGASDPAVRATYLDDTETTFPNNYWTGANIQYNVTQWDLERAIVSYNGSRYTFTTVASNGLAIPANMAANRNYYLTNHVNACTQNGDWAYNYSTKTLSLYSTTNPNTYTYSFPRYDYVLSLTNCDFVKIENVEIEGGINYGALVSGGSNITFDKCSFKYTGAVALHAYNVNNIWVRRTNIRDIVGTGIYFVNCDDEYVYRTKIRNAATWAMMNDVIGSNCGIRSAMRTGDLVIDSCLIQNTGYSGVNYNTTGTAPGNVSIKNTAILKVLQIQSDGGGIYGNIHSPEEVYPSLVTLYRNNYIDTLGSARGMVFADNVPTYAGIYFDSYTSGGLVDSNIVAHADWGYFTNGRGPHVIQDNIMYDPSEYVQNFGTAAYRFTESTWGEPLNTKWLRNIAIMRDSTDAAFAMQWNGTYNTGRGNDVDFNKYFHPFNSTTSINKLYTTPGVGQEYKTLDYFQAASPFNLENSTTLNDPNHTYEDAPGTTRDKWVRLYYNNSPTPHVFNLGDLTLKAIPSGTNVSNIIVLPPYKGAAYFYVSGSFTGAEEPFYNPQ